MNRRKTRTGGGIAGEPQTRIDPGIAGRRFKNMEPSGHRRVGGAPSPGQGVGAWSWVSSKGARRVRDRNLAAGFTGFTWVLNQPLPARQLRLGLGLIDWGIPYSGSQFSIEFASSLRRCATGSGLVFEHSWNGSLGRALEVATFDRLAPPPTWCGPMPAVKALNSRKSITYGAQPIGRIIVRSIAPVGCGFHLVFPRS
jgi:hypothetical protein